ncbi:MAG: ABC transporter permease [Clostridia bacterium]|nr:ABC transporter permease [Clostridia bacterium]
MKKKKKFEDMFLASLIIPIILIILWQLAANGGMINIQLFPSPAKIWQAFVKSVGNGNLQANILVSLRRVLIGYIYGAVLGIVVGVVFGLSKKTYRLFSFLLEILRPIPIIAWVPVLIMILGIGELSKIIVIMIGSFWSIFLNTYDGIRSVDTRYLEVADMFMKTKRETVCNVMLPAALPSIFTGLRIGIGSAWISVIGAELIASSAGLGYMISYSREMAQPANMYVSVLMIGIIGFLLNTILKFIETRMEWKR